MTQEQVFEKYKDEVDEKYWPTLKMGAFYYAWWWAMSLDGLDHKHEDNRGVERSSADYRAMKDARDAWLAIADRLGLHTLGAKKVGSSNEAPRTRKKTKVPLRMVSLGPG